MRDEKRERSGGHETPTAPAEPAKQHGDVLDDLIPRDLREGESAADDRAARRGGDSGRERD